MTYGINIKWTLFIIVALGLSYEFAIPFLGETARLKNEAFKLHMELKGIKEKAATFGTNWEKQMATKENKINEQLPDTVNSSSILNYLLNQFESENTAKVRFLSSSHQLSTATEFKIKGKGGNISPRVSRYKLHTSMKQDRVVPYLEHIEHLSATHTLENLNLSASKDPIYPLEMEVLVGVYLSPIEWKPGNKLLSEISTSSSSEEGKWENWFLGNPRKGGKDARRELAEDDESGEKLQVHFKIKQIIGRSIVVNESIYEEGESIQGWRIFKVDGWNRSVTFKSGNQIRRIIVK